MASIDDEIKGEMESLAKMAKRLGLKGREASKYVHEHMLKLGYDAETHTTYKKKADSGKSSGSGWSFFGGGSGDDSEDEDL